MANNQEQVNRQPVKKLTAAEARKRVVELENKVDELQNTINTYSKYGYCYMCDTHKDKSKFYVSTDPNIKSGITPICKECARKLALMVGSDGAEHEPTKESCRTALKYLDKPFHNVVWDASVQEAENLLSGKVKANAWNAYVRIIAMKQYIGETYDASDFFKPEYWNPDIDKEKSKIKQKSDIMNHANLDIYEGFQKNKSDVIRLLNYDPFEKESEEDQPFLYSQLLGILDASEDANDDMMRTASAINIVRGFLQQAKIDDAISDLMAQSIEKNSATIKSLQESKNKITSIITDLAQDSCISLKYNKNAKKGENTWTGKVKKIKELNLREGEINGFDMETCKAMSQVMDLSNQSIMKSLALDDSEWSDMVADQRKMIIDLQDNLDKYTEISRILLRENLDIKDMLKEQEIDLDMNFVNLNDLYSCFSETKNIEDSEDEDNGESS